MTSMSGTGVTFWWFPDEEPAFLTFLQSTGEILAISTLVASDPGAFHATAVSDAIQKDPDQILIAPACFALRPIIAFSDMSGSRRYYVSSMTSCLLAYKRGRFRERGQLGQSNLSASWKRLDQAKAAMVDKDPDFRRWGERVLRWVRKATPEWHEHKGYRVSRRVKEALTSGEIQIAP